MSLIERAEEAIAKKDQILTSYGLSYIVISAICNPTPAMIAAGAKKVRGSERLRGGNMAGDD